MKRLAYIFAVTLVAVSCGTSTSPSTQPSPTAPAPAMPSGKIAFTSDRKGGLVLYVMNADGSALRKIVTNFEAGPYMPSWSPDGKKIAFVAGLPYGHKDIYIANADGSNVVRLTRGPLSSSAPAWSPDGAQIAFVSKDEYGNWPMLGHICLIGFDGSNVNCLTRGRVFDFRPTWSADGSTIAFERLAGGMQQVQSNAPEAIFVMKSDGSEAVRVYTGVFPLDPAISPDGTRIAFWNANDYALEVVTVSTGDVRTLASATEIEYTAEAFAAWSPDGGWLVVAGCCDSSSSDMYLVSADGHRVMPVANGTSARDPVWYRPNS